jgi:hypothetical protein
MSDSKNLNLIVNQVLINMGLINNLGLKNLYLVVSHVQRNVCLSNMTGSKNLDITKF